MPGARANTILIALLLAACAGGPDYLDDARARRATLVASLVNPDNDYSALRLAHYATGEPGDWDALPAWNPRTDAVITPPAVAPLSAAARSLAITSGASAGDESELVALGAAAFFRYPVEMLTSEEAALVADDTSAARYGFWSDATYGTGGLLRVELPDGSTGVGYSCATCHAFERNGELAIGVTNASLDFGKLMVDSTGGADTRAPALLAWGPGRIDPTTADGTEPMRIPDLRPVRALGYLHQTASVAQHDVESLAVRIETLVVTSNAETLRPPREIALGLAMYVWSLADSIRTRAPASTQEIAGQSIFASQCASCHAPPSYTGPPVPLDVVGTDPTVGLSPDRGTGTYRVPSLLGVGDRPLLFHDASVASLEELFDPARTSSTYESRLGAPIPGHLTGLDLDPTSRAALIAFLRTL
ncbi:MAG TPA: hypothetical protein VGH28_29235 [Polyangiaceae bacterium]|jgi:cytochrome c5